MCGWKSSEYRNASIKVKGSTFISSRSPLEEEFIKNESKLIGGKMTCPGIYKFCCTHSDMHSWIQYFLIHDYFLSLRLIKNQNSDFHKEKN